MTDAPHGGGAVMEGVRGASRDIAAATSRSKIAVVIPCFKVKRHIAGVLGRIGPEVDAVYVVDDKCPESTGAWVEQTASDPRVRVVYHPSNQGVGGATLTGMAEAVRDGADIVVKIDGDGQMDPALLRRIVRPILLGEADYAKGNRFYDLEHIGRMPWRRRMGNAALSFMSKLSSGYWDVFDPTNGYVAIHARVLARIPVAKVSRRYFFESDLLFHLYLLRAVVKDVPIPASYNGEESSLRIGRILLPFLRGHAVNAWKRILYSYYFRDFSIASLYLPAGALATLFGTGFGAWKWYSLAARGVEASAGTVMVATLPIILGVQLILGFLSFDVMNVPRTPVQRQLEREGA